MSIPSFSEWPPMPQRSAPQANFDALMVDLFTHFATTHRNELLAFIHHLETQATVIDGALNGTTIGLATPARAAFTRIGIGTSDPVAALHVVGSEASETRAIVERDGVSAAFGVTGQWAVIDGQGSDGTDGGVVLYSGGGASMWVLPNGAVGFGTQSSPYSLSLDEHPDGGGVYIGASVDIGRRDAVCLLLNRMETDGSLLAFQQDGTTHGTIAVSNGTVTLNGGHTSRWAQVDEAEILRGTIMSSLNEMSVWRYVKYHDAAGDVRRAAYFGDAEDGAEVQFSVEGVLYAATVATEQNEQLTRAEVSKLASDRAVTGVFQEFDASDDYRDAVIAQAGDFVIRMQGGQTPQRGDLIESAGDGTGRIQADDLLRASTVAKVMSAETVRIYDDGSFLVPAQIMCG